MSASTRSVKSTSKIWIYFQCYFVTIATILGTGILGLPVTLTHAGLYPFLISFLLGALMQMLLIYFFTELLQLAHAAQQQSQREELVPLNDLLADDTCDELEEEDESSGSVLAGHVILPKVENVQPPNLHLLGEMFLSCGFRQAFDIILVLQFVALLISYALAGSEAYAQVIGVDYFYVIPVFVWVLTFAVVFALQLVQPVVSILTFFKGSLLLGTVIVTFYVGAEVHREIRNDFSAVGAPFLMGTVALGGVINTMPLMYSKISPVKNQVKNFRFAVNTGLMTCTILNVLWCWAVLDIVPQLSIHPCSISTLHNTTDSSPLMCISNISLESAVAKGEISTIPLSKVIEEKYPTFTWVALLVNIFIMVSITVSYLTVGAVLHHTLQGWLTSFWRVKEDSLYTRSKSKQPYFNIQCVCSSVVSLIVFGIVFGIAMLDPKGFVDMLEKFSSFTLNIEAGVFVFLMLLSARKKENLIHKIPVPLPGVFRFLLFTVPLYFCFAVVYDVYVTVVAIVKEQSNKDQQVTTTQGAFNITHTTALYSGAGHINTQITEGPNHFSNSSFVNFTNVF